jgi:xanthine dehydrogenase iron-sulfur cluster and FAD-binding subunit A
MNAAACADTVPPLMALGATITLQSSTGSRELPLGDLFLKPYQTWANPDELLTAIRFPLLPATARSAFIKLGRRNALSISRLSVAAILEISDDGRIAAARLVPGAAFPIWRRVTAAEQMLIGERPVAALFAAAGRKVAEEMIKETGRRWSTEYKEPVLAVLVRRALEQCAFARVSPPAAPPAAATPEASRLLPPAGWKRKPKASVDCTLAVTINGRARTITVAANRTLLEVLRDDLGLTGTKCGCEIGECGACTVLLDGQAVNSCLVLAPQIAGRAVTTIEGLAPPGHLHPLQESFLDHDAVHCGFCTPGTLLSAKALLDCNPHPTDSEIRTAISGNLCRCTGYQQIIDAIAAAAVAYPRNERATGLPPPSP